MNFQDTYVSREQRYSLGVDTDSRRHYASFPVSNRKADYEEYYWLTDEQFERFSADPAAALEFVESCRRRERDELLVLQPGTDRGYPI